MTKLSKSSPAEKNALALRLEDLALSGANAASPSCGNAAFAFSVVPATPANDANAVASGTITICLRAISQSPSTQWEGLSEVAYARAAFESINPQRTGEIKFPTG